MIDLSIPISERLGIECKSCILAKITKQPFRENSQLVSKLFEKIHLDLIGPITPESHLKHQLILTVEVNYLGYLTGYPLTHEDNTPIILMSLLESENQCVSYYPSPVFSDGGGEIFWDRLAQYFQDHHIQRLISEPYHLEHSSRAEKTKRKLFEPIRAKLNSSRIPKQFLHKILKSCCLGLNRMR